MIESSLLTQELLVAKRLALAAGDMALNYFSRSYTIAYKNNDPHNPVTEADEAINHMIVQGLQQAFPGDAILAEESPDHQSRLQHQRLWCVDPIDGTREFIAKTDDFVVMIGLAINGLATLGVVYQPTQQRLFYGVGEQAYVESAGVTHPLRVSRIADPKLATMVWSRRYNAPFMQACAASLGIVNTLQAGSIGLKIALIALGQADLYISSSYQIQEWDLCAPEAILRAAGGTITDLQGQPLRYNKATPKTAHGVLACNKQLYPVCLQACQQSC